MLFNSYEFLFVFLPSVLAVVYGLRRAGAFGAAEYAIIAASLGFYAWWNWRFLGLLLLSTIVNWMCGWRIALAGSRRRARLWMSLGVGLDLGALAVFKYGRFLVDAATLHLSARSSIYGWILPLGISFWTFEQIIYLVDCNRGLQKPIDPKGYLLFVSFFPRLIAGPIVRPVDFFRNFRRWRDPITPTTLAAGTTLVAIGLFKKVCLADQIRPIVNPIYALAETSPFLSWPDAFIAAAGFALQIYFDFSGYSDIAVGTALLLGVRLPPNFHSPYKSASIIEFWRRWHISLSTFLRDYLYIPLGGNRHGKTRETGSIALTMALGGLWHGAGVNFLLWGLLHGGYVNAAHLTRRLLGSLAPVFRPLSTSVTLYAVLVAWAFFRADSFAAAQRIVTALMAAPQLASLRHGHWPHWPEMQLALFPWQLLLLAYGVAHCLLLPSTATLFREHLLPVAALKRSESGPRWNPSAAWALLSAILFAAAVWMMLGDKTEFIYFQF